MKKLQFLLAGFLSFPSTEVHTQVKIPPGILIVSPSKQKPTMLISRLIQVKFYDMFPGITDEQWIKTNKNYMVTFTDNGIQHRAFLNNRGDCINLIRYYREEALPGDVRDRVSSMHPNFLIKNVQEVTRDHVITYWITLENASSFKIISVKDGAIEVRQELTKE